MLYSIRDFAGQKPFRIRITATHGSVGSFQNAIITPEVDITYQITGVYFWINQGAASGSNVNIWDGATRYVIDSTGAMVLNQIYGGIKDVGLESLDQLGYYITVTTQPCAWVVNAVGWLYKRGEGVLD